MILLTFKAFEEGETMSKEANSQLAIRRKVYQRFEKRTFRVENKTYGVCKVTGKLIGKERLKISSCNHEYRSKEFTALRRFKSHTGFRIQ
jgi:hypothetical protein